MISKYKTFLPAIAGAIVFGLNASAAPVEQPDSSETIHVAFRDVKQNEVLGGVSSINMEELQKKNYINDINTSTLNGYVGGFNGNSLWGFDSDNSSGYLVLIDGVPRDINNIPSAEVESITFMKGAQAVVLYGSHATKGVILVTTKRGHDGPLTINVRANTGWAVAKSFPEYLGAAEYMTLYNEARANDGLSATYTAEQIYNTSTHSNPYRYPDLNMYSSEYLRKVYNRSDADIEIQGGNERAKFYANINYYRQGDLVNFGEAKNDYTDRFSVRGNVNLNISKIVSAYVDAATTFYSSRSPQGDFWSESTTLRPNRIAPYIPISYVNSEATTALGTINNSLFLRDGYFPAGTSIDDTNVIADIYGAGYSQYTSRQFQFDTGVNLDLNPLVKGLKFNTQFAVDYATTYNTSYSNSYAVYVPTWSTMNGVDEITAVSQEGTDKHSGVQSVSGATTKQTIFFSAQLDYQRRFADVHNLHAIAVAQGWQRTTGGTYHRKSSANIGFQVNYDYDSRYYVDLAIAGLHSAKFAPGHRQAWSPSATLGWRLSQESFLRDNEAVNELMISASASKLHTDVYVSDFYLYTSNYTTGGWFSWAPGGTEAAYPERGSNTDLTYITREEYSANLRGQFFNNLIGIDASVFTIKTDGLLITNSTKFPSYFTTYYPSSSFVPYLNNNANRRTGFDFGVDVTKSIGDVNLKFGVNGTYYNTKALVREEVYENDYQYTQGKAIDALWGYKCLGFFATDAEAASVDQSALGGGTLKAGDLKYADINGDGKIDTNDQVDLGKGGWYGDPFVLGVNITAQWKGFTLFIHGTGGFGAKAFTNNDNYYWISGDDKYSTIVRGRWTPETADSATYPRLTTQSGANNFVQSDFWMYSTDRFNLSKVQLTYDLPAHLFNGKIVKGISVYLSGDDLAMISKNRKIMELNIGSQAQCRFYNIGAKVNF